MKRRTTLRDPIKHGPRLSASVVGMAYKEALKQVLVFLFIEPQLLCGLIENDMLYWIHTSTRDMHRLIEL